MTDKEFLHAIYQMRSAQKDVLQQKSNFNARTKARGYENIVDAELEKRMTGISKI